MTNTKIMASNLSLDFPIYHFGSRSMKKNIASLVSGSKFDFDTKNVTVKALKNLNFEIRAGDRVGVTGPNGAGKSTLLRVLCGIYTPTTGRLEIEGKIGSLVDVGSGVDQDASGWENIDLFLAFNSWDLEKDDLNRIREEIGHWSGIGDFLHMPVRNYSSGMAMRLTFSMETYFKPDILIMDEWLSTGDASFREKTERRIKDLVSNSKILVIASHNPEIIEKHCNRRFNLEEGVLLEV